MTTDTVATVTDGASVASGIRGATLWQKVIGVAGIAVVLWVGTDLFDIVTSAGDRPGAPARPPAGPTEVPDGDRPPTGEAPHDPSQFNH